MGIWIDPTSGSANDEVGRNHDFVREDSIHLPELPVGHIIRVSHDPNVGLLVCR